MDLRSDFSTIHLLVALLKLEEKAAALQALKAAGANQTVLLTQAEKVAKEQAAHSPDKPPGYSDSLFTAINRAEAIREEMDHTYLGTEHLLLTLFETGDAAANLLQTHKLDRCNIRRQILRILGSPEEQLSYIPPIKLFVHPGSATPEIIASILSDISDTYRTRRGSGLHFEILNVYPTSESNPLFAASYQVTPNSRRARREATHWANFRNWIQIALESAEDLPPALPDGNSTTGEGSRTKGMNIVVTQFRDFAAKTLEAFGAIENHKATDPLRDTDKTSDDPLQRQVRELKRKLKGMRSRHSAWIRRGE
jgi:hypothetical protein